MIPPLPTSQLAARISRAVREANEIKRWQTNAESLKRGEMLPVPEAVPPPVLPTPATDAAPPPENRFPLETAANQIPRARDKITVPGGVPTWLRPLYRNQGGFNFVLLEALEQLIEANRQLQRQNHELHERVAAIDKWAGGVAEASQHQSDWMTAVEGRLRPITADRLARIEARLSLLEREVASK